MSKSGLQTLLQMFLRLEASDLHLKSGRPPLFRIHGKLLPARMPELTGDAVRSMIEPVLSQENRERLSKNMQVDFSFPWNDSGRFRCSLFVQRTELMAVLRRIPVAVPSLSDLGLPESIPQVLSRCRGLFLVTGATGQGKSTSLAAMVRYLNETVQGHILCLEDPIEFLHTDITASVTQREIGNDARSFNDALVAGLRQDPDVIVLGELRDVGTIQTALSAAETGHLVLSTLHTRSATSAIERILDVLPHGAREQARVQLASSLSGVLCQCLVDRADGSGRLPACELMISSPSIQNSILKNELKKLPEIVSTSTTYYQMRLLNQDLERLVRTGAVTIEEALKSSENPEDLKLHLGGITRDPFVA